MKKVFIVVCLLLLLMGFANRADAIVLTFEQPSNLGVFLGGNMRHNTIGGGHLYMETWTDNDYVYFSTPTIVNSFQMNAMPCQGASQTGNEDLVTVVAFDGVYNELWRQTIDLSGYKNWNNWYTVSVGKSKVKSMTFYATGSTAPGSYHVGFWPSIDNMRINESLVPEPMSLSLLGLGLVGVTRRKFFKKSSSSRV